jgi:hypothetical protein
MNQAKSILENLVVCGCHFSILFDSRNLVVAQKNESVGSSSILVFVG